MKTYSHHRNYKRNSIVLKNHVAMVGDRLVVFVDVVYKPVLGDKTSQGD